MKKLQKIKKIIKELKSAEPIKESKKLARSLEQPLDLYDKREESREDPAEFFRMLNASYKGLWDISERTSMAYGLHYDSDLVLTS